MLAPYSPKASREDKVRHLFAIWDVDGDGVVSKDDMELLVRQAGGSALSDEEVDRLIETVFEKAGVARDRGLRLPEFRAALEGAQVGLHVEVPVGY